MQIKSREYEVFTFADVMADENLKKKVLDKHRYINVDYDWWWYTKDDFHSILGMIGFWDIKSNFSGFCSQGDGASFSGKYSYEKGCLAKVCDECPQDDQLQFLVKSIVDLQRTVGYKYRCIIKTSGRHCHEYTMETYLNSDYATDSFYDKLIGVENEFLDLFKRLAKWYYKKLENEYDYLTSDEALLEWLELENFEFTKEGEIFQTT